MSNAHTIQRTIFTAVLVQDSALSISGIDTAGISDRPFTRVDGIPLLSARGLKGAAVAMARRCFALLPRSVSEAADERRALVRSAWRFEHARQITPQNELPLRAGVGILQQTGARADGVLYDLEVVPAGASWQLELHVDWRLARAIGEDPEEAEGILGYVLAEQWAQGRCWLGGGVARGLGWCHLEREQLRSYRFTAAQYDAWLASQREELPPALARLPRREPTRSWCFRTLELTIPFGEHRPDEDQPGWGVDMLAIGAHAHASSKQLRDDQHWVSSRERRSTKDDALETKRAIVMEGDRPLLPGSSLRGPLRHAYSRQLNALGENVKDPHDLTSQTEPEQARDPARELFGTLEKSSRLLIRDSFAEADWLAARLQQHAEDELTGGSYGSAKRDAIRLLSATFRALLLVEGPDEQSVQPLCREIERIVALGELGHLPIGGHKTRGAGWCRWRRTKPAPSSSWTVCDVISSLPPLAESPRPHAPPRTHEEETGSPLGTGKQLIEHQRQERRGTVKLVEQTALEGLDEHAVLNLGEAARLARAAMTEPLSCWWCEPRIVLTCREPPLTFGRAWPSDANLSIDEVVFFGERECWRAARTRHGWRAFFFRIAEDPRGAVICRDVPATLHVSPQLRFSATLAETSAITLLEWREGTEVLGFTAKGSLP